MDRDKVEVHKQAQKERGQYPAILTEQAWSIKDLLYGIKHQNMINFPCGTKSFVYDRGSYHDDNITNWIVSKLWVDYEQFIFFFFWNLPRDEERIGFSVFASHTREKKLRLAVRFCHVFSLNHIDCLVFLAANAFQFLYFTLSSFSVSLPWRLVRRTTCR